MHAEQRHRMWTTVVAAAMAAAAPAAIAEDYPAKPIRLICPSSPGGTTDYVARLVGQGLTDAWGKQVVVDDRPGSGGIIGTELAAKSPADAYTLLLGTITTHAINPAIHTHLSFDPLKDFRPVSLVVSSPQLLVVHPSVPASTLKELIALAKAKPGKLNYGSAGSGNSSHLVVELLKSKTGIDIIHVPYKGSGPASAAMVGGEVQMMITGIVPLLPHVKAGRLRAIAVTTNHRAAALPDIPTIEESGVRDFNVSSWFGIFAPAGSPEAAIRKLNREIVHMLHTPVVQQRLTARGVDPAASTPDEFAALVKSEMARWRKVAQSIGLTDRPR